MTEASIQIKDLANGVKSVVVSGQLDESNVDEKIKVVYEMFTQTPQGIKVIFDLENLDYMNSKSIGYLTDIYGKVTERGGKMVITKAKDNIIDILQVVGLTQLIQTFASNEEAMLVFGSAAPASVPAQQPTAQQPTAPAPASEVTPQAATPEQTAPQAVSQAAQPRPVVETAPEIQINQPTNTAVVANEQSVTPEPVQQAPQPQVTTPENNDPQISAITEPAATPVNVTQPTANTQTTQTPENQS